MADNNLKQWLMRHAPAVIPGDPCTGLKYGHGSGYQKFQGHVTRIGREYLTTDIFRDSRFQVRSMDDPYLIEADSNGLVQMLFLSDDVLSTYIRKEELALNLRQHAGQWAEKASVVKLEAAIALLDGTASEYVARQVRECIRKEQEVRG